jgi:uncharacterized delta-60 repeat protein
MNVKMVDLRRFRKPWHFPGRATFVSLFILSLSSYAAIAQIPLDPVFNAGIGTAGDLSQNLYAEHVLVQPDDKVLVSGIFKTYNGQSTPYIMRLNEDGTLDPSFKTGVVNDWIRHMALQPDGKIVIGGAFSQVGGASRNLIARLNSDGSLDSTFNPGLGLQEKLVPPDPNPPFVFWLALQADGKILCTGSFAKFNGEPAGGLVRLNADGTRDTSFNIGSGFDSWGRSVSVQPNGQIMFTGWFVNYNGFSCNRMVLVNPNGTPDSSFLPFFGDKTSVYSSALLPDGKRIVSGHTKNDQAFLRKIARLNPDGSIDSSFVGNTNDRTEYVMVQADGKILASGWFSSADGVARQRLARFNPDGTLDPDFWADFTDFVWTMAVDSKGRLLAAGAFDHVNGVPRQGIVRLLANIPTGPGVISPPPPPEPPVLTIAGSTAASVNISWTDSASPRTGYSIEKKEGPSFSVIGNVDFATRAFTISGLAPQTSYTFRVRASNADVSSSYSNEATVATRAALIANSLNVSTAEGQAASVLLSGTTADSQTLSFILLSQPQKGQLTGTPPNLIYIPAPTATGSDSFTYAVSDGATQSPAAAVNINIIHVNHPPIANALSFTGPEKLPLNIILSGTDPDGDTLTFQIHDAPQHGQLSGTAPTLVYTPSPAFNGTDAFTYSVKDGTAQSAPALVNINIIHVNRPPTANALDYSTGQGVGLNITLTGTDPDGDALSYQISNAPQHGQLSGSPPTLIYTPVAGFHGGDSFTYIANDGAAQSSPAIVSINVASVNHPPVASSLTYSGVAGASLPITLSATDSDGDALTYQIISSPQHGRLSGTGTGLLFYVPDSGFSGTDTFSYAASDGLAQSTLTTVTITVTGPNQAPVANNLSFNGFTETAIPITLAGTDADGNALTYQVVSPPANGQLSGTGANLAYMSNIGFSGMDSMTYIVTDGAAQSAPATVTIVIARFNQAPSAQPLTLESVNGNSVQITLSGSDPDGDSLIYRLVTNPAQGEISGTPPNLLYTPSNGANGSVTFSYIADDGSAQSAPASVTIKITPANQPPNITAIQAQTVGKNRSSSPISVVVSDPDSSSITSSATSSNQGLIPDANLSLSNGDLIITPAQGAIGSAIITVRATDGLASSETSFSVTVENTPPQANDDNLVSVGGIFRFSALQLTSNDTDADGDALSVISVSSFSSLGGSVSLENGQVVYISPAQNMADDQFQYTIQDSSGATATGLVHVRMQAPPQIALAELRPGVIVLKMNGLPNSRCEVLKSIDAVSWAFAAEGTSDTNGEAEFTLLRGSESMQFYRLRFP